MKVSGEVKPVINPLSVRTTSFSPGYSCEGSEIKIGFTTMGGTIAAQARYKLRFSLYNESSGVLDQRMEVDAVLKDNYLVARVPSIYNSQNGYRSSVKVQVIVESPKIVGSAGENTLYVYPKPTAEFFSSSRTINMGDQIDLNVRFSGLPPFAADLGNGIFVNTSYSDGYSYTRPSKTTSYVLKDFSTGCGPSTLSIPQTLVATVNTGIRIIPDGQRQILCTGTLSRIKFETNATLSNSTTFLVHANLYGNRTYTFTGTRNGDYIEFTIPPLPENTSYENSYDNLSNIVINTYAPYLVSNTAYNGYFSIQQKPSMVLQSYTNLDYDTPGYKDLYYALKGGYPFTIEEQDGKSFTTASTSLGFQFYLDKTKDFIIKSISNTCGKTDNPVTTRVNLNSTSNTGIYINLPQAVICSKDSIEVFIQTTGNFGEGNVFTIQGTSDTWGTPQTLKTVNSPGTYKVKLPAATSSSSSSGLIKVTSNNPVHSSSRNVTIHAPIDNLSVSPYSTADSPARYTQPVSPIYLSFYANNNTINSVTYTTDGMDEKTVSFNRGDSPGFYVTPPTGKTTVYTIKSATNLCETRTTNLTSAFQVQPYSINLSYDIPNKFCAGQQIIIPFQASSDPGNATFSLQFAPGNANSFTTILTSTDKFRITGTLPASVEPGNYTLRIISSDGSVSNTMGISVNGLPSAVLSSELPSPMEIESYNGATLKITLTGNGPWWVTDAANTKINAYYSPYSYNVYPKKGQDYSLKSVYNACGYGTVSGAVSVKVKPSFSVQSNQYTICEGSDFTVNYDLKGDVDLANDYIRFELVESNSGRKTVLDSTKIVSGSRVLKIPSGLPNGYYQIRGTVRSYNLNQALSVSVVTKADVVISGNTIINPGETAQLSLKNNSSSYGEISYTLSNGATSTFYGSMGSGTIIRVTPSQTTTYTLVSAQNICGAGRVSGSATVEVNPPSDKTVSTTDWLTANYGSMCMGDTMSVYYTTKGNFTTGNVMTIQISDTTGRNFRNITTIGNSSPLRAPIPADLFIDKQYSIRVVASDAGSASGAYQSPRIARSKAKVSFASDVFFFENQGVAKLAINLEGSKPISYAVSTDAGQFSRYNIYNSKDTIAVTQVSPNLYYRITSVYNSCGNGVIGSPSTVRVELITGEPEEEVAITLAPNPTSDFVYLKFATPVARTISLYSAQGVPLYQKSIRSNQEEVDLQRFSSGIYILTIENKGKTVSYKVIKN